jgi:hypothetical protein
MMGNRLKVLMPNSKDIKGKEFIKVYFVNLRGFSFCFAERQTLSGDLVIVDKRNDRLYQQGKAP